ncbi:DNA repair protein RecN [Spiribacter vilamensis]|uniref:DNA repair protein RecN n=1 Tax=Spiribacter vilamensis TaxID=531306 RepID=A0A4Q8CZJ4_9GAMM|nr:DNA repair protein RecN [Spiribacter vilamensis]RZU98433.1 DNA replication and repair protein RecN [Spiribacter vilamensis]TVO60692.1 DNA repair protein RecN [Spiribacter vilamensis]
MLNRIEIRDFAIIDYLGLNFETGLTVLTGETGAGKSILLDALGLCLGDRADTSMVPETAKRSEIHGIFDVSDTPRARAWLSEESLDEDDDCLIRRVVQRSGRSQAWINGRPVTRYQLEQLGARLMGIHGQHAHQALMRTDIQRRTLDGFAVHPEHLATVADLHSRWRDVNAEIESLSGGSADHQDRIDLLRYQLKELDEAAPSAEEFADLEHEQRRLASAGDIMAACQRSLEALYDGEISAQSLVASAERDLQPHLDVDAQMTEIQQLLATGQVQIDEACQALRAFADHMEMDPQRLQAVEDRLTQLHDLARKHQIEPEDLATHTERLRYELERLESADERLVTLQAEQAELLGDYRAAAEKLSASRQTAAETLGKRVGTLLGELGMAGAELIIVVEPSLEAAPSPHGADRVRFDIRTNADQRPAPLQKIASGGELSRIGLALEVATADTAELPSLIFDEADSGIGGAVAEVVGRQLRDLARHHQVICITHLPQVAAQGMNQLQVEKRQTETGRTVTDVQALSAEQRIDEIARMLGGLAITEKTLNHAREMLDQAG